MLLETCLCSVVIMITQSLYYGNSIMVLDMKIIKNSELLWATGLCLFCLTVFGLDVFFIKGLSVRNTGFLCALQIDYVNQLSGEGRSNAVRTMKQKSGWCAKVTSKQVRRSTVWKWEKKNILTTIKKRNIWITNKIATVTYTLHGKQAHTFKYSTLLHLWKPIIFKLNLD